MLLSLPFRSADADTILQYAVEHADEYRERRGIKDKSVRVIVDHAVPIAVMVQQLFEPDADLSREGVRNHLTRLYCLGLLTNAEDVMLKRLGLQSRMPARWDGDDLTARYREAGIAAPIEPNAA